jgi:protein-disulfide isomerase
MNSINRAAKWTGILAAFAGLLGIASALLAQNFRSVPVATEAALIAHSLTPATGGKTSDVTIVEYFDYNCPFCKKSEPELKKLLHVDAKVRIVYKEWPVFGEVSEYAARAALAANWQGKYLVAHDALISVPNGVDAISQVDAVLKNAGIDLKRIDDDRKRHAKEINAELSRSIEEAQSLGFHGTPGFVIGPLIVPRSLNLAALQQLVANARAGSNGT